MTRRLCLSAALAAVALGATAAPSAAQNLLGTFPFNFGEVAVGTTSAPKTFDYQATSEAGRDVVLTLLTPGLGYGVSGCEGGVPTGTDRCTVSVTFSPPSAGPKNTQLQVSWGPASNERNFIPLSGTGVGGANPPPPDPPAPPADPAQPKRPAKKCKRKPQKGKRSAAAAKKGCKKK